MRKLLFTLTMALALVTLSGCSKPSVTSTTPTSNLGKAAQIAQIPPEALKNALNLFSQAKQDGKDLSNGPCLGKVADDWVLDIAHNPRQTLDDKPENQCEDIRAGNAHHFIELDPQGQIIQAH